LIKFTVGGRLGSGRLVVADNLAGFAFADVVFGFAFVAVAFFVAGFFAVGFFVVAFFATGFFFVAMIFLLTKYKLKEKVKKFFLSYLFIVPFPTSRNTPFYLARPRRRTCRSRRRRR
jgi:hypothetical protein